MIAGLGDTNERNGEYREPVEQWTKAMHLANDMEIPGAGPGYSPSAGSNRYLNFVIDFATGPFSTKPHAMI